MVHASLSRVGMVEGGAAAVVATLRDILGPAGTLVVPTFTPQNSDTSTAHVQITAGMSPMAKAVYRENMPAFDPLSTPSYGMGVIAETVRLSLGAIRSTHPQTSHAAIGAQAQWLMESHARDCHLGENSPLARLYESDAQVLLLGVGFDRCTAFHLAEYRYLFPDTPTRVYRCVVNDGDGRKWCEFVDAVLDDSQFAQVGADFLSAGPVCRDRVGGAVSTLFPLRAAVDHAVRWLRSNRSPEI
ncbi:AAC(3) family N-acetyltransferase [Herbidospora sp. NBRC 101105]|uniref:aminoglycoside N(3)-acetyltransferase n=1 Tax=Herbidospora sp. NBRC 101105 TaxID=3032195 RepID=UPI0024A0523B|nr:AAC(3) family N-acetyltransferase [Herbidospora sp. NBRC 101105]GLX93114.1 AAC(3) family N-acetyltransferase [Herbidospora sp. NBRC 101105]